MMFLEDNVLSSEIFERYNVNFMKGVQNSLDGWWLLQKSTYTKQRYISIPLQKQCTQKINQANRPIRCQVFVVPEEVLKPSQQ
jgi:hypothetical protein